MVLLRDGRTLIGYLRSVDQFANLVLHKTIERIHVGKEYGDIPRGVFIVRGENVVLLGEIVRNAKFILELYYRMLPQIRQGIHFCQRFIFLAYTYLSYKTTLKLSSTQLFKFGISGHSKELLVAVNLQPRSVTVRGCTNKGKAL